ncbi:hypothetical protein P7L64_00525 (plasmid) [Tistrella bauzanensis]
MATRKPICAGIIWRQSWRTGFRSCCPISGGEGKAISPAISRGGTLIYSKRDMAAERLAVMRFLGHDSFLLVGHDRGARVARRLALDNPGVVTRLVVMDIVPALDFYENSNAAIAQDYFYFSFLTQDYPILDRLIAGDPDAFLRLILSGLSDRPVRYDDLALQAYLTANATPAAVTAMCECFRAGYHIDRLHDRAAGQPA